MSETRTFEELLEQVRAGSEAAATELFQEYSKYVLTVVRQRLNRQMRVHYDSVDFTQAVWASFFRERSATPIFESPDELIRFLANLARNKVIDRIRHASAAKRRDVGLDEQLRVDATTLKDPQPSPSAVAYAGELRDTMANDLPNGYQLILAMREEGKTHQEIADHFKIGVKTVQRLMRRVERNRAR